MSLADGAASILTILTRSVECLLYQIDEKQDGNLKIHQSAFPWSTACTALVAVPNTSLIPIDDATGPADLKISNEQAESLVPYLLYVHRGVTQATPNFVIGRIGLVGKSIYR